MIQNHKLNLKQQPTIIPNMKTILVLSAAAIGAIMTSSCGSSEPPTEIHNVTVVQPKPVKKYYPKPKPLDRPEDFRATTTPN